MDKNLFEALRRASIIEDNIHQVLRDYYYNTVLTDDILLHKVEAQMGNWYQKNKNDLPLTSFSTLILYALNTCIPESTFSESTYDLYAERRRQQKRNWLKPLTEEIKGQSISKSNPHYLEKSYESYIYQLQTASNQSGLVFAEKKSDYMNNIYNEIVLWSKNAKTCLVEYKYFHQLKPFQQVNGLFNDVICSVIEIIRDIMYGNMEDGYVSKVPSSATESSFFGMHSETYDSSQISFDFLNGIVKYYTEYKVGNTTIRTDLKLEKADIDSTELSVVDKLKNDYKLTKNAKALDSMDYQLLTIICSSMTAQVFIDGTMTIPLKTLVHAYYPDPNRKIRERDYVNVLKRVNKLAEYTLSAVKENADMVEKIILHFFDIHFQIPTESKQRTIREADEEIALLLDKETSELSPLELSETILHITPGKAIADAWKEGAIRKVYSKTFALVEDSKVKMFLTILESERIRQYPKDTLFLSYDFFINRIHFNTQLSKTRAEIERILKYLYKHKLVVKKYVVRPKIGFDITFIPFTDVEKLVYRIEDDPEEGSEIEEK